MEEAIKSVILERFKEEGFEDFFIVEIKILSSKVEVFVDSDTKVVTAKCASINRAIRAYMEEEGLDERYGIEVSSPGINRPLKFARQYRKNIGRKLEVVLNDDTKKLGLLKAVQDDTIILEEKLRIKEKKRNKTIVQETEIALDAIEKAVVQISFK